MSAVKVIRALLVASGPVVALVPAAQIVSGVAPQGIALPAMSITEVSSVPVSAIDAQAEFSLVTSRVQVTLMAKDYPSIKTVMEMARKACNFARGTIAGVSVVSVVRDTVGPDFSDDAVPIHFQSIDFKVTYHEPN
jgi:hypothetical protein